MGYAYNCQPKRRGVCIRPLVNVHFDAQVACLKARRGFSPPFISIDLVSVSRSVGMHRVSRSGKNAVGLSHCELA